MTSPTAARHRHNYEVMELRTPTEEDDSNSPNSSRDRDQEEQPLVTGRQTPPGPATPTTPINTRFQFCTPYLGILLATISSIFFSMCSAIVKYLETVHPMELSAWRFAGIMLPSIAIMIYRNQDPFPRTFRRKLLLRCIVGAGGLMLSFYAFRHMPLADASVIVFSVPVFVAVLACIFLKEPCGVFDITTIILSLIGVVLIARPPFIFGTTASNEESSLWGAVAACASTMLASGAYILTRELKHLHFSVILSNFGSISLVISLIITFAIGEWCFPKCGKDRWLILALMALSFLGQVLLTKALSIEKAGPVAIARTGDIVFAFIWQVWLFDEVPNAYSMSGAILVTCSVVVTGMRKWLQALPESSPMRRRFWFLIR